MKRALLTLLALATFAASADAQVQTRRYGFPFHGLVNSVDDHEVGPGAITSGNDFLVSPGATPGAGRLVRRRGSTVVGDSAGVLEMVVAQADMAGIELYELLTPSAGSGYPQPAVLFADESRQYAQLHVRAGSTDYTFGEDFGSTHYPTSASTQGDWKVPALAYDGDGATGYTRGAFEENRRRMAAGTRRRIGVGGWEYGGGFDSSPWKWNRAFNTASGSGSENARWNHMGHVPPLWAPKYDSTSSATRKATVAPWVEGDRFFLSVMYEWEDGSRSMPFIPREINATLTTGLGRITLADDKDGTVEYFDFIRYRDIPRGPPGVRRRILLRSPKLAAASTDSPNPTDLRVLGILENNTQTTYDDPLGDDDALVEDTDIVRFDHMWPKRARYAWTFDQRVALGYVRQNPNAIIVAPAGVSTAYDINAEDDDAALVGSTAFTVRVTTLHVELKSGAFGSSPTAGKDTYALTSTKSLQQLVDEINASAVGDSGRQWVAALVPGTDGSASSTELAPTVLSLASATNTDSLAVTSAALYGDVAEGMKVTGTGIAAGTYVVERVNSSRLVLSAVATATGSPTLTFHVDTGDESVFSDSDAGDIRCYGGSFAQPLAFRQAFLDATPTETRGLMYTGGGPAHAPFAANSFYLNRATNHRTAEADAGVLMGGAALRNGSVVFYSRRIYWLVNERAGGSGEDADYRLRAIDFARGCISPWSIVQGNGWVGCMTSDGFWVFDGERVAIITRDILDRDTAGPGRGELAYEATASAAAAASDGTDFGFHAHYRDGRLWLKYRTAAATWAVLCYDCTPSVESSGLGQVLKPDGTPYGWSTRLTYSWRGFGSPPKADPGCIGSVRGSDGVHLYSTDDADDGTRCGLLYEFEIAGRYQDGGSGYIRETATLSFDLMESLQRKSAVDLTTLYYLDTGEADASNTLTLARHQAGTPYSLFALARTTGSGVAFTRRRYDVPSAGKSPAEGYQFTITGSSNGTRGRFEFMGIEFRYRVLRSLN